jgi:hypothetical protein
MKKKKFSIKYEINKELQIQEGDKWPLYIKMSYDRKNTKIKSSLEQSISEKEFDKVVKSNLALQEIEIISRIMSHETDGFTKSWSSFKGFKEKLDYYRLPIDEAYKDFGIKGLEGILIHAVNSMPDNERIIYDRLRKFFPFDKYLNSSDPSHQTLLEDPQTFMVMLHGYLKQQSIEDSFEGTRELLKNLEYYQNGYRALHRLQQIRKSKKQEYLTMIDWMEKSYQSEISDFILALTNDEYPGISSSLTELELGFMHSPLYRQLR